jgi:hypothetical protein
MAAAAQTRTRLVESALNDTLAWVVENMPLTDAQRERITERMREWKEPSCMTDTTPDCGHTHPDRHMIFGLLKVFPCTKVCFGR